MANVSRRIRVANTGPKSSFDREANPEATANPASLYDSAGMDADFASLPESVSALSRLVTELRAHLLQNVKVNKALKSDLARSRQQVSDLTVERESLVEKIEQKKEKAVATDVSAEVEQLQWERDVLSRKVNALTQALESSDQRASERGQLLERIQEEHREEISLLEDQLDAVVGERDCLKSELAGSHEALEETRQSVAAASNESQQTSRKRSAVQQEEVKPGSTVNLDAHRDMVIGKSPSAFETMQHASKIAAFDVNVLITGESGTGKEVLARWIHSASTRAHGPFEVVDLPSIPAELFESVLFGHERGSFTGAIAPNQGGFQRAQNGTLFLDEISTLRWDLQPKLLRAIQEKEVKSVGGRKVTPCDVRIIAATNVNLADGVKRGEFRADLFYRLNVVTLNLVPLRQRREDIPELLDFFIRRYVEKFNRDKPEISAEAHRALESHGWPGNIRELENRVQRAMLVFESDRLSTGDFFEDGFPCDEGSLLQFRDYEHTLAEIEQEYINRVLQKTNGNKSRAAQILQIDRKTLRERLRNRSEQLLEERDDPTLHLVSEPSPS